MFEFGLSVPNFQRRIRLTLLALVNYVFIFQFLLVLVSFSALSVYSCRTFELGFPAMTFGQPQRLLEFRQRQVPSLLFVPPPPLTALASVKRSTWLLYFSNVSCLEGGNAYSGRSWAFFHVGTLSLRSPFLPPSRCLSQSRRLMAPSVLPRKHFFLFPMFDTSASDPSQLPKPQWKIHLVFCLSVVRAFFFVV